MTSKKIDGVELILVKGTRIPKLIRIQDLNVTVSSTKLEGKNCRKLRIKGAEAHFAPSGNFIIKMPGSSQFWVLFQSSCVIEIRDWLGKLIKQNAWYCPNCGTNTGLAKSSSPGARSGAENIVFRCTSCSNQWTIKDYPHGVRSP